MRPGRKIKYQHLEWIVAWVNNRGLKQFTLPQLREALLSKFPDLDTVALSTLSITLRKKVGMSYKKLGLLIPKQVTESTPDEISN